MAIDLLRENDTFVCELRLSLRDSASGLSDVPGLLKCILREARWRSRVIQTGQEVGFDRFEDFVATKPLEGLGADVGLLKRICGADPEALDLLDRALQRPHGGDHSKVDIVNLAPTPDGNSERAALRRLRKDRPDLHAKVLAREMSSHAAMIEAGFRRRSLSVPHDPQSAGRLLARHFTPEQFDELVQAATDAYGASSQARR